MRAEVRTRPARGGHVAAIALGAAALVLLAAAPRTVARERTCPGANVVVSAADSRDATTACDGAVDAVRFLEAQGLDTSEHTQVHVVAALPTVVGPTAMGCYRHSERRVYVLTFGAFQKHGTFVGLLIDRVLHRSLITHEVAHAIAACNFAIPRPTIPAQEYLAYVAMFATMPEPHRTRALARFPGEGFRTAVAINLTIYQMSPDFFGAQAYRHFLAPGNGTAFLRQILSGGVLASDGLF
jgi:hypothetical protein